MTPGTASRRLRAVLPVRHSRLLLPLLREERHARPASVPALAAPTLMLRSPDVSADHVVFAYAQNIWIAPRAGGAARPLTTFQGHASGPRFSPDGQWVAFSGEYAGNLDVYVVPAAGGVK